ncbi:hypothetical protein [Prosthecobacter sp.]|uniref:hypothetical protein n=1 Tax=Prosthecobacter sp. TaxID=1965333 RepID=UPI003784986D
MKSAIPQDVQMLILGFSILGGLFLVALVRIFQLSRSNRRMRLETAKMEKQAALQQLEITAIHHDAMSWRARAQRQFDALRSDLSHRLLQSEQGGARALADLDKTHQKALSEALVKISELEAELAAKPLALVPPPLPLPAALPKPQSLQQPALPALPAMETLRIQALESDLAMARAELAASKQQNAVLQRALLLARRKPAAALRKSHPRSSARNA